jgi:hypothetical protein
MAASGSTAKARMTPETPMTSGDSLLRKAITTKPIPIA